MKRFLLLAGYLCFSSAFAPAQNSTTIRGSVKLATGDSGRILPRGRIDAESVRHGSARRRNVFRRSFRDESAGA